MAESGIIYAAIARGPTLLCHNSRGDGNFDAVAESMLKNIPRSQNNKTSYSAESYTFHVVVKNELVYLCATKPDFRKQRAYAFLDEVVSRFSSGALIVRASTANHLELQRDFSNVLSSNMAQFSRPENDNITQLQSQVNEVKGVMTQNIEKVLQRGENLDTLIDKTTDLEATSNTFRKTARKVSRKFWWQNLKMKIILGVVIVVVLALIIVGILAGTGAFKAKPNSAPITSATTVKPVGGDSPAG